MIRAKGQEMTEQNENGSGSGGHLCPPVSLQLLLLLLTSNIRCREVAVVLLLVFKVTATFREINLNIVQGISFSPSLFLEMISPAYLSSVHESFLSVSSEATLQQQLCSNDFRLSFTF